MSEMLTWREALRMVREQGVRRHLRAMQSYLYACFMAWGPGFDQWGAARIARTVDDHYRIGARYWSRREER